MSSTFASIAQGLQEAIELNQGKPISARTHHPVKINVTEVRKNLGLTQMEFSSKLRIGVVTLPNSQCEAPQHVQTL